MQICVRLGVCQVVVELFYLAEKVRTDFHFLKSQQDQAKLISASTPAVLLIITFPKDIGSKRDTYKVNQTTSPCIRLSSHPILPPSLQRTDTVWVFMRHLPWPLLRDVRRAELLSPGVSPLVSPREALGSLQAATAALLGFTFILERYGDPAHIYTHCI